MGAQAYLKDVLEFKKAIPFKRFTGGCGRHAQGHQVNAPGNQVGWPIKPTKHMLDLLTNIASNAEVQGLDVDKLIISHMQVNQAPKMRRRTYRAHGRINAYMSEPCHVELMCTELSDNVAKDDDAETKKLRISRKRAAV